MTSAQKACRHERLFFGSGCFYIICRGCQQMWVAMKSAPGEPPPVEGDNAIDYDTGTWPMDGHDRCVPKESP